jgi:hypothetical protein
MSSLYYTVALPLGIHLVRDRVYHGRHGYAVTDDFGNLVMVQRHLSGFYLSY